MTFSDKPVNLLELELMRQAIQLAASARGRVEPNPMVGCIIHRDGQIIGRGCHERFGGPHAEPNALADCRESPAGASAVVTLEPCCHTNKKTPPCVPALIRAGIQRVVVSQLDPNPNVFGEGVRQLRAAGIHVCVGVLAKEAQQLNAPFFAHVRLKRPYITLKWAQTADGYLHGPGSRPIRISGPSASQLVHHLRTRVDAILVSSATVLTDDPLLTVRDVPVVRRPVRVILDRYLRTPVSARLVATAGEAPTHLFTAEMAVAQKTQRADELCAAGVIIRTLASRPDQVEFPRVTYALGEMGLTHLLVEPGPRLAHALIQAGGIDRVWIIRSARTLRELSGELPDRSMASAPSLPWEPVDKRRCGDDTVEEYLNPGSPAYFAPHASPEFHLPC